MHTGWVSTVAWILLLLSVLIQKLLLVARDSLSKLATASFRTVPEGEGIHANDDVFRQRYLRCYLLVL